MSGGAFLVKGPGLEDFAARVHAFAARVMMDPARHEGDAAAGQQASAAASLSCESEFFAGHVLGP